MKDGSIGEIKNLGYPVNSSLDDFAFYMYSNNRSGFFSSNRLGGKGDDDIYSFTVTLRKYTITSIAKEKGTGKVLSNTSV